MVIYAIIIALLLAALIRHVCSPAESFSALSGYYLSGDGDWELLPGIMTGASATADSAAGLVPVVSAGKHGAYLRGDGTWQQSASIPSAAQYLMATSNVDQPAAQGSIFQFPDTISASGAAIVNTAAGFVLQANCTYKCTAQFALSSTPGYLDYIWYNITAKKSFGNGGGIADTQFYAMAVGYITTVAPTTIGLYITYNQSNIAVKGNNTDSPYMRGPWAIIEMVSNNAVINMPASIPAASSVACQGALASIVVLAAGTLYASAAPKVTIAPPPPGGVPATAQAIISGGAVVAIILTSRGAGYTADPVISIGPPQSGGTQAAAIAYAVTTGLESPSNCGNSVGTTSGSAYIMADGSVRVLGRNYLGCQGLGTADMVNTTPVPIMWAEIGWAAPPAVRIWAAYANKYVLGADGYLYGTGKNDQGGLGLGHTSTAFMLSRILLPIGLVKFACSNGITANPSCLALLGNGQLYGWGRNASGELGLGHTNIVTTPARIPIGAQYTVAAIYCVGSGDMNVSYLLLSNGQVMAAGTNEFSQCGNGNGTNQSTFGIVQAILPGGIGPLTGITQIAVSGANGWALAAFFNATAGTWYYTGYTSSMGSNMPLTTYAALWKNTTDPADPPVAIFASGNGHGGSYGAANMALITAAGNLWSWGYTCLRPVAVATQPFPGLSWSAGGVRKVCLYSYMNNAVGVILLKNGEIYYNGISKGQASTHYRSASGTTADTGGNWVRSYLHRRDIVDITITGDAYNPNVQVLTSTGEVYISGWNSHGQLGVGDTQEGRVVFTRAQF